MRRRRLLLLVWASVWLLILQTPAWSILIETKATKRKVGGYVVSEDAKKLVLRVPTGAGKSKTETFDLSTIKVLHRVDRARLEKLTRDNPAGYREYADKLAEQTADPEALEMAIRLYLIAAHLDADKLGRSCLLKMSEIATSPAEARKYRAMAFVLDGKRDAALVEGAAAPGPSIPVAAWQSFQRTMRKFRAGAVIEARELATAKGVDRCFAAVPGMIDQVTFIQACTDAICSRCNFTNRAKIKCATCNGKGKFIFGNPICPTCNGKGIVKCPTCEGSGVNRARINDHAETIVRAELRAIEQLIPGSATPKKADVPGWSSALHNPQLTPIPLLTLETITDYDPRKCVFRNGSWVAP